MSRPARLAEWSDFCQECRLGAGFLLTPLVIFIGVRPTVAVASSANQLVGASARGFSAVAARNVDFKMGYVLLTAASPGSFLGVWIFTLLNARTNRLTTISLSTCSCWDPRRADDVESVRTSCGLNRPGQRAASCNQHNWMPGCTEGAFPRSKLYISALLPIGLGFVVGVFSAILHRGGFILVPAMITARHADCLWCRELCLQIIFCAANSPCCRRTPTVRSTRPRARLARRRGIGARIGSQSVRVCAVTNFAIAA